jgi:hypothetical protein
VKASEVNCTPWSLLKTSGLPWVSKSSLGNRYRISCPFAIWCDSSL